MREPSKAKFGLRHIMEARERLEVDAGALTKEELVSDVMRYYGIVKNIEIIGEAARMLSNEFKNSHTEIPWRAISNMRNLLVHEYFNVDSNTVWEVIHSDIVLLKKWVVIYLNSSVK